MNTTLRVGILAGESSGDILGASLMQALRRLQPNILFEGIGGPLMQAEGLHSRHPMERLAVMGIFEPLKRLPELLHIRRDITNYFLANPPAVFIGIDSPDFNLTIESRLHAKGIPTVHYVSPSVWAWRQNRVRKIAKAVDLVLTLFPFEADFYQKYQVPVCFVGHPLADIINLLPDSQLARSELNLLSTAKVIAFLPGSRQSEVARLGPVFLQTAELLSLQYPNLMFLFPCSSSNCKRQLQSMLGPAHTTVRLLNGQSRLAMEAADVVVLASGTATLEAMLLKKPMLVCYKMAWLSFAIISRLLRVPYFSLPNLLAGESIVEELVQKQVNPSSLVTKVVKLLSEKPQNQHISQRYMQIHQSLRMGASNKAAQAVMKLL